MKGNSRPIAANARLLQSSTLNERLIAYITKWEVLLVILFVAEIVLFSFLSPYFLDSFNLLNATFTFMEKAVLALPMIFVIMSGDIDISVAAILSLCSFAMGNAASQGAGTFALVLIGLGVGTAAGIFNGFFITKLGIPAIAVTLATQSIFRGISQAVLEDQAYTVYPESFAFFGQGYIGNTFIPFELVCFAVLALIVGIVLHKSAYGRKLYAVGSSREAARFAGIAVNRIRFVNFTLNGLFSGAAAVLLTSRIGSTRPNIALGWDMEAITLVVLGGVAISGGKGTLPGVVVAVLLLGYLKFGMGLLNFSAKAMIITTGILLIVAVLLPSLLDRLKDHRKLRRQQGLEIV